MSGTWDTGQNDDNNNVSFIEIVGAVVGVLLLIAGIVWLVNQEPENYDDPIGTYELRALADKHEIDGSGGFFLLGGYFSINSDFTYYFYRITDNGGYVMEGVDRWALEVFEDIEKDQKPYAELWDYRSEGHRRWEVHIPKGSITNEINLDLK
ncbi:hypothetical protein LCGC14_2399210 [marine sediment metagenome]|uniref:Uncharacterized protein n=1 Tax=marine sediment metagenome TaxID=412755 RepID=A0A0F9BVX5_9ZZZZ